MMLETMLKSADVKTGTKMYASEDVTPLYTTGLLRTVIAAKGSHNAIEETDADFSST